MLTDLLYRCPACGGFEWLAEDRCRHCDCAVEVLSRKAVAVDGKIGSIDHWYRQVRGYALHSNAQGLILESGQVVLSRDSSTAVTRTRIGIPRLS